MAADVYREVCLSAAEAEQLFAIADRLQVIADASDVFAWAEWAALLRLLHRRFERQEPIEIGPSVRVLPASGRLEKPAASSPASPSRVAGFSTRPALELIPGGAA